MKSEVFLQLNQSRGDRLRAAFWEHVQSSRRSSNASSLWDAQLCSSNRCAHICVGLRVRDLDNRHTRNCHERIFPDEIPLVMERCVRAGCFRGWLEQGVTCPAGKHVQVNAGGWKVAGSWIGSGLACAQGALCAMKSFLGHYILWGFYQCDEAKIQKINTILVVSFFFFFTYFASILAFIGAVLPI